MHILFSPWEEQFLSLARSVHRRTTVAAPFITRGPLERFVAELPSPGAVELEVLTDLAPASLLGGFVDCQALATIEETVACATIHHVPGLHAKAYVADEHTAIVTSANCTYSGIRWNRELGVKVSEPVAVQEIAADLGEYARLGKSVSADLLKEICTRVQEERRRFPDLTKTVAREGEAELGRWISQAHGPLADSVLGLRGGESTTAIFRRAVHYALRRHGSLTTTDLHAVVKSLLPDLCDDRMDRIINGVSFGRKWKHHVRNAQQQLKRQQVVTLSEGRWRIA